MQNYIIAYHSNGKTPETADERSADKEQWREWVSDLGEAVVNPGTPLVGATIVSSEGVSTVGGSLTGYSVVQADSIDAAIEMAVSCPFLAYGTVEVAEMKDM